MLNILTSPRNVVLALAGSLAIVTGGVTTISGKAHASDWKTHACWCKHNHSRLHGWAAARAAAVLGPAAAVMPRSDMTRWAIRTARYDPNLGYARLYVCQFHNPNAVRIFAQNRSAVTRWLANGGQC